MEGLSATLVYIGIGSVLAIGVAILTVSVLFLRTARRYLDLAETRLELLREGQALLLEAAHRQDHASSQESREPERPEKIPEVVGHPLGRRKGEESSRSQDEPARPVPDEVREKTPQKAPQARETTSRPRDGAPPLGVKVAHPDDDVTLREWNSTATKFFQKCYDRYLEHYEGYVRLAERIQGMRDEASPGTVGRREWDDKLRQAYDAIERTTQRLDILEEHYPELATDSDRISSRISTARLHAGLAERIDRPR